VLVVAASALLRSRLRDELAKRHDVRLAQNFQIATARVIEQVPAAVVVSVTGDGEEELSFLEKLLRGGVPTFVLVASEALGRKLAALGVRDACVAANSGDERALKQHAQRVQVWLDGVVGARRRSLLPHGSLPPAALPEAPPRATRPSSLAPRFEPGQRAENTASTVICIGISTGGPEALETLFRKLPRNAPPIVIVQHMPAGFTGALAERLNHTSRMRVAEAHGDDVLVSGSAFVAPGNLHLRLRRQGLHVVTELYDGPPIDRHRPSVNVLFESAARVLGPNAVGVLLTGMGDDGARGLLAMHTAGSTTVAQSADGCTVFGMPQRAIALGAARHVVALSDLATRLLEYAGIPSP
jgi:two-component system chemotaxis response regulator CheB